MTGLQALGRWRTRPVGLQLFEPARDLAAVTELLRLGFAGDLDAQESRWLAELEALASAGPLLSVLRFLPPLRRALGGMVWYEDGRLVGNASLLRVPGDVWLIANVVTHPDYRRRGIARRLTEAVIGLAYQQGARRVQLQVRRTNQAAQDLYARLGFRRLYGTTTLRLGLAAEARRLARPASGVRVVRWGGGRGLTQARRLLSRAGYLTPDALGGPAVRALERQSLLDAAADWLQGRRQLAWAAAEGGEFRAVLVAVVCRQAGCHELELVVDAEGQDRVEASLVDAALIALARYSPLPVEAKVRDTATGAVAALEAAGFVQVRTLDRMAMDLD